MNKKLDCQKLEDLLDITYTIQFVYEQLAEAAIKKDEKEYQEALENLKMCLELENKIYQKIPDNLEQINRIINKLSYLNHHREKESYQKDLVITRITNYLNMRSYLNPFLSMESNREIKYAENQLAIYNQYFLDYQLIFIHLLDEKIQKVSSNMIASYLVYEKYENVFFTKPREQFLLNVNAQTDICLNGRTNCLLFQQDESFVQKIYYEESFNVICSAISDFYTAQLIANSINEDETYNYIYLIVKVESALYLLNEQEQKELWNKLWRKNILNKSTNSINNLILNIFSKVRDETSNYTPKSKERIKK